MYKQTQNTTTHTKKMQKLQTSSKTKRTRTSKATLTSVKAKEHFQTSTKRGTNSKTTGRRTTHHETHHLHDLKTTKPGLDTTLPTRQRDEYLHARNGACPAQGRQRGNGVLSGNATTSNMKRGGQVVD